jgi:hypothetical protein
MGFWLTVGKIVTIKMVFGDDNFKIKVVSYMCPNSWAMVKAALSPLSSMMAQLRNSSHMVPSSASPSVSHFPGARQMSCLQITIIIFIKINRNLISFKQKKSCLYN